MTALRRRLAELNSRRHTIAELAEQAGQAEGPATLLGDAGLAPSLLSLSEVSFPPELRPVFTRLLALAGEAVAGPAGLRDAALTVVSAAGAEVQWLDRSESAQELHPDSVWRRLETEPEMLGALHNLLGDVITADDGATAEVLLGANAGVNWVVQRDGTALYGRGHAVLGQPSAERVLRLAKHSDLAYLASEIDTAKAQLTTAEQQQSELREAMAGRQGQRDEGAAVLAAAEAQLPSQLELCDRLLAALDERRGETAFQQTQAEDQRQEIQHVEAALPVMRAQCEAARQQQAATEEEGRQLAADLAQAENVLAEGRTAENDAAAGRSLAEQSLQHLETLLFDLAERRHNGRVRLEALRQRLSEHDRGQLESAAQAAKAEQEAEALVGQLTAMADRLVELRAQRQEHAALVEDLHSELEAAAQSVARAEQDTLAADSLRERAIERVASWLDQLREKYGMTLSELLADPALVTGAGRLEEEPGLEDSAGDGSRPFGQPAADPAEAGRLRLREAKLKLTLALEDIGPVNLLAIEQHEQHRQRLAFLDTQAAELAQAVLDLERLIHDLDRGTETRYRTALELIESKFAELFTSLFDGGSARLRFDTPDDIVSSGVEIEVQLPGSKRMALRSLSGGQRSLIFLALFFAVHSVRSPGFCILDEADAALDDANVKRYSQLIQRFALTEQFIIVTHNKQTMEVADRLVGVVGRPKGVSNLLAVDLKKAHRLVDKPVVQGAA